MPAEGLRGRMEAGFSRMNDVTVIQASQVRVFHTFRMVENIVILSNRPHAGSCFLRQEECPKCGAKRHCDWTRSST